jgi:hypothetical protein
MSHVIILGIQFDWRICFPLMFIPFGLFLVMEKTLSPPDHNSHGFHSGNHFHQASLNQICKWNELNLNNVHIYHFNHRGFFSKCNSSIVLPSSRWHSLRSQLNMNWLVMTNELTISQSDHLFKLDFTLKCSVLHILRPVRIFIRSASQWNLRMWWRCRRQTWVKFHPTE